MFVHQASTEVQNLIKLLVSIKLSVNVFLFQNVPG